MSMFKKVATVCAASTLLCLSSAYAEEAQTEQVGSDGATHLAKRWIFNVNAENLSIDDEVAALQGIEPDAFSINVEAEYFLNDNLSTVIGLGFLGYDDNEEFSQLTEDAFGDVDNSSSSASALPLVMDMGYTRFYNGSVPAYVTLRGGLTYMFASERAIENCSDCSSQDIDVDGGMFVQAGAGINLGRSFTLGLYYKNYFSGDIEDAVGLRLSIGRFRSF